MSQEVKSDNELIEEFYISQGGKPHVPADLWFYESDWNMIMPVVEKITKTNIMNQAWYDTKYALIDGDIKTVYTRVVDFIKWYNSQPK